MGGRAKDNRNGVVLFVFLDDRKMFIQAGYGLKALCRTRLHSTSPSGTSNRDFRANDFEGGLTAGIDLIFKAIRGEYKGTGRANPERHSENGNTAGLLVFFSLY